MKYILLRADFGERDKCVMVHEDEFEANGKDPSAFFVGGDSFENLGVLDIMGDFDAENNLPSVMEES